MRVVLIYVVYNVQFYHFIYLFYSFSFAVEAVVGIVLSGLGYKDSSL